MDKIEKQRQSCRDYYIKNKDKKRNRSLMNSYGITIDEYNDMFTFQEGRCKGCEKHQSELSRALYVDHCHKTGKVRGLLCHECNTFIGLINDDISILKSIINYLYE